jgi:hypothetical protein
MEMAEPNRANDLKLHALPIFATSNKLNLAATSTWPMIEIPEPNLVYDRTESAEPSWTNEAPLKELPHLAKALNEKELAKCVLHMMLNELAKTTPPRTLALLPILV